MNRKALSPVIATILLVSIALVLALIIFLWAKSFVGDAIEKDGQAVELVCEDVNFKAEAYGTKLYIENIGNVPLYGVEIRKKELIGEVKNVETFTESVAAGETSEGIQLSIEDIDAGDTIIVVPILLGETNEYKKAHVCEKDFGEEIIVGV